MAKQKSEPVPQKESEKVKESDMPIYYSSPIIETEAQTYDTQDSTASSEKVEVIEVSQVQEIMRLELSRWLSVVGKTAGKMFDKAVAKKFMERIQQEIIEGNK